MNGAEDEGVAVVVAAHPVEEDRRSTTRMLLMWTGVAVVLVVALGALLSRENTGSKTVPPQLVGTWTSAHPDYSDRYLVLTSDSITFGIGGTSTVLYSIIGVAVEGHHDNQFFVVHFQGADGTRFRREIVLDETGVSLHFKSQPGVVWTRLAI
jgi:hypothetical protein